jgi:hypothetical protein
MNGPRSTGPEYTGKHRRDSGPGVLPPAWGSRPEARSRPAPDSRPGPVPAARPGLRPESGLRSELGQWLDAG